MTTLYVLYDGACGVCCRAVARLSTEPSYIPLRFAPAGSIVAQQHFAAALEGTQPRQVVVVADSGEVYRGSSAWIMVLYALKRWRPLAMRLATPGWRPHVDRAVDFIGRHRHRVSGIFHLAPHAAVLQSVHADPASNADTTCSGGACQAPAGAPPTTQSPTDRLAALARARRDDWALEVLNSEKRTDPAHDPSGAPPPIPATPLRSPVGPPDGSE